MSIGLILIILLVIFLLGGFSGRFDQGVGKARRQVGPVPLVAIAFLAGLLVSRRKAS